MRVIAGKLKGRIFYDPSGHYSHPMSDKIRGALFNMLGDINGLTILDAFSGSGALAIEAVSRGAKSAVTIEQKRAPYGTTVKSIKELGLNNQIKAVNTEAGSWSNHNKSVKFDIVLLDPPFGLPQFNILDKLVMHAKTDGIVVVSWPGQEEPPRFNTCEVINIKKYGDAQLIFYRKN